MSPKNLMDCLRRASDVPPERDSLFAKAVQLSDDAFEKVFEGKVRLHQGFSVVVPKKSLKPPEK